jgi:signal transduction histidine kinase
MPPPPSPPVTLTGSASFEGDAAIIDAALLLADKGMFGAIWTDAATRVQRTLGQLAEMIVVGEPLADSLLALIGQDAALEALKRDPSGALTLTNISMPIGADLAPATRMNVSVYWRAEQQSYLVLLGRVLSSGAAEAALENEIRRRRIADAELARINRQLEEFAYVISHDLKAPLRALRYYSTDITEALADSDPDRAVLQAAGQNIAIATRRMSNMLVGLLEYSSIGRQHEAIELIDTGKLVHDIVGSLAVPNQLRIVIAGPWPSLKSAAVPLDLVLRNLIDNAVKHHDRPSGEIRLSCEPASSHVVFVVADDGPGIDPEWQQAIFLPFSRIDDSRNPESSGIGLALVKRTVENAGGRIDVRSDPAVARGTTFRVTWPKR